MARRKQHGARIIAFPSPNRLDPRAALLDNQSDPTVRRPAELDAAIDARARELAEQAFELCREHLRRRVAHNSESGWPRTLDLERARLVIAEGDLGDALVRVYREKMQLLVMGANMAAKVGENLVALAAEVKQAADLDGE